MGEQSPADILGDSLIPVINKLQDIFNQVGCSSPTALVIVFGSTP